MRFIKSKLWAPTLRQNFQHDEKKKIKTVKHSLISFAHILCIINEERVAPLVFEIMKRVLFISSFFWFQIQHNEYAQFHVYSIVSNIITHLKKGKNCKKKKKTRHWFFQVDNVEKKKKNPLWGCKKLNPRRRNRYVKGFQSF